MVSPSDPNSLDKDFTELQSLITKAPKQFQSRMLEIIAKIGYFVRLQARLVKISEEAVDQLQLDIKYLMFDVEATSRERDELRQFLQGEDD